MNQLGEGSDDLTGNTFIGDGVLSIISDETLYSGQLKLEDLQHIYITRAKKGPLMLYFFDHTQHWLPLSFDGSKQVLNYLSDKYGIDQHEIQSEFYHQSQLKKLLWRKKHVTNYTIISEFIGDQNIGLEFQNSHKTIVSWDLPLVDVFSLREVHIERSVYGHQILSFDVPVRIGNVILGDLHTYIDPGRTDAPVLHFYAHCYNEENNSGSYDTLKNAFKKVFAEAQWEILYERDDQNCINFYAGGMEISLIYTFDSEYFFDGGYTLLAVKNEREYPELLKDEAYEAAIEISEYLLINERIISSADYKRNDKIKEKFASLKLKNTNQPLVWIDNKNQKIGFADRSLFQIFDHSEIKSLTIQNVLPAKGGGGAYLEINFSENNNYQAIFSGNIYVFDKYRKALSELIKKEVLMAEEYYDC